MCWGPQLPLGIPVLQETFDQYPVHVQQAWKTFHSWLEQQLEWMIPTSAMPPEVLAARQIILDAPVPGYPGCTGKNTCYMAGVSDRLYQEG